MSLLCLYSEIGSTGLYIQNNEEKQFARLEITELLKEDSYCCKAAYKTQVSLHKVLTVYSFAANMT